MPVKFQLALVLTVLLTTVPVWAQDGKDEKTRSENPGKSKQPSIEFLEFLGSYEDENGKWMDPAEVENLNVPGKKRESSKKNDIR